MDHIPPALCLHNEQLFPQISRSEESKQQFEDEPVVVDDDDAQPLPPIPGNCLLLSDAAFFL